LSIEELFLLFSYVTSYREGRGLAWKIDYRSKLAILLSAWASVLYFKSIQPMIVSTIPVFVYLATTGRKLSFYITALSSIPAIIVFAVVSIVSPYSLISLKWLVPAFIIGYKVYVMSVSAMSFMTTTNPVEVSRLFSRFPRVHDYNIILSRLIPLVLKDLGLIIGVQRSLGRPVHKVLFPLTLSMLKRGDELAESLYMRGYGLKSRRTIIRESPGWNYYTVVFGCMALLFPFIALILF
jgi:energy-coupling factor transporter transmembrane protein EcfT